MRDGYSTIKTKRSASCATIANRTHLREVARRMLQVRLAANTYLKKADGNSWPSKHRHFADALPTVLFLRKRACSFCMISLALIFEC